MITVCLQLIGKHRKNLTIFFEETVLMVMIVCYVIFIINQLRCPCDFEGGDRTISKSSLQMMLAETIVVDPLRTIVYHVLSVFGFVNLLFCLVLSIEADVNYESSIIKDGDMSLWIDEMQVKQFFNGFPMKIHAIVDGVVLPYVRDPNFEKYLPVIPSQVTSVNFTWKSGENRNYYYDFDQLQSFDNDILKSPILSINSQGFVPKKSAVFQVFIPCVGNQSGIASFTLGLTIINVDTNQYLDGTPLRLKLQKQCTYHGPDPECDKKCGNNGKCNPEKICVCPTGKYCESALCYPQCMNGGTCIAPGVCLCSQGFQGLHCEGGICSQKCLNGGKCIQKDSCLCRRGYYGPRCEYSKCLIPCLNSGKCVGVNRCRCRKKYTGSQCQVKTNSTNFNKYNRNHRRKSKKKFV